MSKLSKTAIIELAMSETEDKRLKQIDRQNNISIGQTVRRISRRANLALVAGQLIVIVLAAIIYTTLEGLNNSYSFIITMTSIVVIEVLFSLLTSWLYSYPLDIITRSMGSILNEKPTVYPPNPNRLHGPAKNELNKALNYLYTRSNKSIQTDTLSQEAGQVALGLLHSLPVGIIALDYDFHILAYNDNAPVQQVGNAQNIQLDFRNSGQPLREWFNHVKDTSISATQNWTRIQNVPSGSIEPRHVYDVVATYHQHATNGVNLIIITIDRTNDYVDSEDNIDFVALAAHELRGPVTVIRGYLDMLDDQIYDKATADQQALLDRLNVSAKRLASYVNNVLNANRYDRNHLKLKLVETTIVNIISGIQKDLNLRATTVGRSIEWRIPDNLPTVAADTDSIGEVITNLVDNAIKYSPKGGVIQVTAKRSGDFVAVSVIDHGIGIARSATEHLFTKFYRSHRSSASVGGTGIGLYISRGIVESHGGQIGVDSVEGQGSTFTFTIPIYSTVRDKLVKDDNENTELVTGNKRGWIDNHGAITK